MFTHTRIHTHTLHAYIHISCMHTYMNHGLFQVESFAMYLGMDVPGDKAFYWIAVEAMTAPLPVNWSEHFTADGQVCVCLCACEYMYMCVYIYIYIYIYRAYIRACLHGRKRKRRTMKNTKSTHVSTYSYLTLTYEPVYMAENVNAYYEKHEEHTRIDKMIFDAYIRACLYGRKRKCVL